MLLITSLHYNKLQIPIRVFVEGLGYNAWFFGRPEMVVSTKGGPRHAEPNITIVTGTPQKVPLVLGNPNPCLPLPIPAYLCITLQPLYMYPQFPKPPNVARLRTPAVWVGRKGAFDLLELGCRGFRDYVVVLAILRD